MYHNELNPAAGVKLWQGGCCMLVKIGAFKSIKETMGNVRILMLFVCMHQVCEVF